MKEKTKVIVSRRWDNPEITAFISDKEVGATMALTEFITALVEEVGNPTMLVSKAALKAKLLTASAVVVHELKTSTASIA